MRIAAVACIGLAVALAGCGTNKHEKLPPACLLGPESIEKALNAAPGRVAIDGTTPISSCFNRGANGDDVEIFGSLVVAATEQLSDRARSGDARAALKLGYLTGATERGNSRNNGVGSEIVRRVEAESDAARAHRADYNRGRRAGLAQG